MNIAIDISPLTSEHSGRGVGVYAKLLIKSLQEYEPEHTYNLFTRGQKVFDNVDLVHYPYFDPFFLTLPLLKMLPAVVTVHDLIPMVFPDKFPSGLRGQIKWQIQKLSLMGVRRIITDSKSSKNDIHRIIGFDDNRIDVVYLAPSPVYKATTDQRQQLDIRKKYSLPHEFIIYVGDVNWNKNILGLLRAYVQIRKEKDISLVLVGKAFTNEAIVETKEINNAIRGMNLESSVIRAGYVPESDLAVIYSMAMCLVQPSFYEGFGLPVLEAQMCGCPVVAADNSSLSEISGPAIRIQADDDNDIASGIDKILSLPDEKRTALRRDSIKWAAKYTWRKAARETVHAYEKVVSRT